MRPMRPSLSARIAAGRTFRLSASMVSNSHPTHMVRRTYSWRRARRAPAVILLMAIALLQEILRDLMILRVPAIIRQRLHHQIPGIEVAGALRRIRIFSAA